MLTVYDQFEQNSPEWFRVRCGVVTASNFQHLMRENGKASKTRRTYLLKLAGERMSNLPAEGFTNLHMERGKLMEPRARETYAFVKGIELRQVAFIHDDVKMAGCSPDSIVMPRGDGLLEIKTALPHVLIDFWASYIRNKEFPPEHKAQCQGALWLAEELGVEWIDIQISHESDDENAKPMPPLRVRAYRDDAYIKELAANVLAFNADIEEQIAQIRQAAR